MRHVILLSLSATLLALLSACDGTAPTVEVDLAEHADLRFLQGRVLTGEPVVVAPGSSWSVQPDGQAWTFKAKARLLCHVSAPLSEPLAFFFQADGPTTSNGFGSAGTTPGW